MKKQLILVAVFSVIIFGFGFKGFAQATNNVYYYGDSIGNISVTPSDLGVDNVGTLPTSHFYFFKQWGRGIQRFFTFNSVAKAELELNITNQIAAELLEVEKTYEACAANALGGGKQCKPGDKVGSVKNALQNFTKAQERLIARLAVIKETSENPKVADLLKKVDEKIAKHAALLEQVIKDTIWADTDIDQAVSPIIKDAQNNIQKTFTTAGDKQADVKQKATDEIATAETAIKQAETVFGQPVTFTATVSSTSGDFRPQYDYIFNQPADTSVGVPIPFLDISVKGVCAKGNPCTSATGSTTGKAYTASTGSDGSYTFTGLAPGTYDVEIAGQVVQTITVGTEGTISGTVMYSDNHGEFRSSTTAVINGGDLLISTTTTAGLAVGNIIRIDNELMLITALTPTSLTVQRGANGSTAGVHLAGARLIWAIVFGGASNIVVIANAKSHLQNARTAFADGKYGEAYGQARSAEAMVVYSDNHGEFKTAPTGESTGSPKTPETPANKATPDKTETPPPASAGSPAGAR